MKEYVGKVCLDTTYYPGEDLYSDGAVEDEMLKLSEEYTKKDYNREIDRRKSWPVLYHFSHIRENIVNWLPLKGTEKVLEVGAGLGAVTGALAKKAAQVTCIDLSLKRSRINANRHKEFENVEILVGNFLDIEKDLPSDYDYITLIGVLEYASGYMDGDNPYARMLKRIAAHVKPGGKIVLAIENRLGLKYWAGCTEDHNGKFFEGLEGYPTAQGARTFSRKELERIFEEADQKTYAFYYPYPDYKFPMAIYSDRWLPGKGELREVNYNFDRARLRLFDETRVYDTILENELYPIYANSFLTILTAGEEEKKEEDGAETETEDEGRIIYVKYSNERDPRFAVRTEIYEKKDGSRSVRKVAETREGEAHLNHIHKSYQLLKGLYRGTSIEINRCEKGSGFISLAYEKGTTLEEMLDALLEDQQIDKLWETLNRYLEVLKKAGGFQLFVPTKKFTEVFGSVHLPDGLISADVSNIDCICSNLIWDEQKQNWQMLDYEWTFAFPIPVNYLVYRVLTYYLFTSTMRAPLLEKDFFGRAGLTADECAAYERMEMHFQRYITGNLTPMRRMYDTISPGTLLDLKAGNWEKQCFTHCLQVFEDLGEDFSEANSWLFPCQDGFFSNIIPIDDNVKRLRLDPTDQPCIVKIRSLCAEQVLEPADLKKRQAAEDFLPFTTNGVEYEEGEYFFDHADPQFIIEEIPPKTKGVVFVYEVTACEKEVALMIRRQLEEKRKIERELTVCQQELSQKKELIRAMENTKVWKLYRTIKKD